MTTLPAIPKTDPAKPIDPRHVEAAVTQSLKRVLGCSPTFRTQTFFPAGEACYSAVVGVEFGGGDAKQFDAPTLRDALNVVEHGLRPAAPGDLAKAVAYLSVRCKRRETSEADTSLAVRVMIQDLSELPGDVALWVLDEWSRRSPWWPTRSEILELSHRHCGGRRWMKMQFERALREIEKQTAA